MGINYEENPFIMGVFQNSTCPSKWVLFQTFNTHIRVKINEVAPLGPDHVPCGENIQYTSRPHTR